LTFTKRRKKTGGTKKKKGGKNDLTGKKRDDGWREKVDRGARGGGGNLKKFRQVSIGG